MCTHICGHQVNSKLADMPSRELLQLIREEIQSAEVVHAFPTSDHNPGRRQVPLNVSLQVCLYTFFLV